VQPPTPEPVKELAAMTAAEKLAQFNRELAAMPDEVFNDPDRYTAVVNDLIAREVGDVADGVVVAEAEPDFLDNDTGDEDPQELEDDLLDAAGDVADVIGDDDAALDGSLSSVDSVVGQDV
jgi:hypothetical protein